MARAPQKTRGQQPPEDGKPAGRTKNLPSTKTQTTALTDYEKRLEQEAEQAAEIEKGGLGGKSFSFKGGQLSFDGNAIKGNKIPVVVVASAIEKAYYEGRYDPTNPEPPVCFALTQTDPDDLAPNPDDVADLQHPQCSDCPHNQWGSADTGRGKACKDVRRLAMIPAGSYEKNGDITLFDDPKAIDKGELGFAKLPPTALNAWGAYVRQLSTTMKRPPHGVFTELVVEPDPTNQFKVTFEAIDLVPKPLLPAVYKRHDAAVDEVMRPYTYPTEEQKTQRKQQAKSGRSGAKPAGRGAKPTAASGRARKY